jgi:hypothetical protein
MQKARELYGHERRVPQRFAEPFGELGEHEGIKVARRQQHRCRIRHDRPHQHLHARDVVTGQGQQPLTGAAERGGGCRGAAEQRIAAEHDPLGHTRRPGGFDHDRYRFRHERQYLARHHGRHCARHR